MKLIRDVAVSIRQHCLWISHAISLIAACYKAEIVAKMFLEAFHISFCDLVTVNFFRGEADAARIPIPPPLPVPRWPCEIPSDTVSIPPPLPSFSSSSSSIAAPPLPPLPPPPPTRPPSTDEEFFVRDLRQISFLLYGGLVEVSVATLYTFHLID